MQARLLYKAWAISKGFQDTFLSEFLCSKIRRFCGRVQQNFVLSLEELSFITDMRKKYQTFRILIPGYLAEILAIILHDYSLPLLKIILV